MIVPRLMDVIFVQLPRVWVSSLPEGHGGWLGALRDRQIGTALARIHRSPTSRAGVSRRAAGHLQDGVLSLGEIAARVGCESDAAFSRALRRRFGMPPGAWRRRAAA